MQRTFLCQLSSSFVGVKLMQSNYKTISDKIYLPAQKSTAKNYYGEKWWGMLAITFLCTSFLCTEKIVVLTLQAWHIKKSSSIRRIQLMESHDRFTVAPFHTPEQVNVESGTIYVCVWSIQHIGWNNWENMQWRRVEYNEWSHDLIKSGKITKMCLNQKCWNHKKMVMFFSLFHFTCDCFVIMFGGMEGNQ